MRSWRKNRDDIENRIAHLWEKASQLNKLGRYKEAIDSYDKLLTIVRLNFGESNQYYARLLNNLGLIYHRLGNYNKAERLYKEASEAHYKVVSKVLGESHQGADGLYTGENQNELSDSLSGAADVHDNLAIIMSNHNERNAMSCWR
jgi:tetratricopeptide (TPR) repeat protein